MEVSHLVGGLCRHVLTLSWMQVTWTNRSEYARARVLPPQRVQCNAMRQGLCCVAP